MKAFESPEQVTDHKLATVQRIATEIARVHAADVDSMSRFPAETIHALREARLLSLIAPSDLEYETLKFAISHVTRSCRILGRACASSAMIFAMHQIQLMCLLQHGRDQPQLRRQLHKAVEKQWLIASATSEVGVGGDIGSSVAAIVTDGEQFTLEKRCPVISFGAQADALLVTARRNPDAPWSDQQLVFVKCETGCLEPHGNWDALGMRGTCSPPFTLHASGSVGEIFTTGFREISARTIVPFSHLVWSSVWLGIADDAFALAHTLVQRDAQRNQAADPTRIAGAHLADAQGLLQVFQALVTEATREYESLIGTAGGDTTLSSIDYAIKINSLKISASRLLSQICQECLSVCGMRGYVNNSEFSLGRHIRDALSAALMISNDRISATNAGLLLVAKASNH